VAPSWGPDLMLMNTSNGRQSGGKPPEEGGGEGGGRKGDERSSTSRSEVGRSKSLVLAGGR
jgi:hypothetical protein